MTESTETTTKPQAQLVSVDGKSLPLKAAALTATAGGGIAASTLRQSFENPYDEPMEVFYTLPLPADGAVIGYTIRMGAIVVEGEIEKREDAERKYRKALEEGRLAGLLEQERADTFHQSLGNLPARTPVEVEIRILQPLIFLEPAGGSPGRWEFRFPTVVGVRYMGAPGRVTDRERIDPDRADEKGTGVGLDLQLTILDGADVSAASPSHSIQNRSETTGEGHAATRVMFQEAARLDRDLRVLWRATVEETGARLTTGNGLAGDAGRYALLTLTPSTAPGRIAWRDLTLLIDASGSMSGFPLRTAKDLAARLIRRLGPADGFEIIAFADRPRDLLKGRLTATPENARRALGALEKLEAGGGTEMRAGILSALAPLRGDAQRQVILMTDGYIGFEQEVIGEIMRRLPDGCRVHAVGIGLSTNRSLTRGAARAGRGCEILVSRVDDLETAAARLLAATEGPVLTDIEISGTAVRAIAPSRCRDVLAGRPAVIAVELAPGGGDLSVRGRIAGTAQWEKSFPVEPSRPAPESDLPSGSLSIGPLPGGPLPIGALFGREAIEDQEMRLAAGADSATVLAEIERLGLRHRIPSRRTSLVAVSQDPAVDPKDPRRRVRLPVEMPADVEPEGVGLLRAAAPVAEVMRMVGYPDERFCLAEAMPRAAVVDPGLVGGPTARVVRQEGDLLILEFESPHRGFELRHGEVAIFMPDGSFGSGIVDPSLSTKPGRHEAGLTIRLAVRIVGSDWPKGVAGADVAFASPDGIYLAIRSK